MPNPNLVLYHRKNILTSVEAMKHKNAAHAGSKIIIHGIFIPATIHMALSFKEKENVQK